MGKRFLEAGIIVNTHGISGEVRIQPWADSPDFLANFDRLYIDGKPVKVMSARTHKSTVIVAFDNITDIDSAIKLKNKIVSIDRDEVPLEEGQYFVADLVGLSALDAETGANLGVIVDVLQRPANNVYVIKGERDLLVAAVPDFVIETNIDAGYVRIRVIEGM